MYGLSDRLKPLSAAEEQVLLALWECPAPATPAGYQRKADRHRLGSGHGAQLFVPSGGKGLGQGRQGGEPEHLSAHGHPPGPYCVAAMRQRMDTLFGGSLPEAVRALASESGASQSQLEQAIRVLEEQHQEAEEYDLYDPYG